MGLDGILVLIAPLVVAGIAQTAVIRFALFPRLAVPLDANLSLRGRQVFGPNKTWRGVVVMTAATALAAALILPLHPPVDRAPTVGWAGLGAAMGLAYVLAELPNSFVKRRLGIGAGRRSARFPALQYMVDQADSAIGATVVVPLFLEVNLTDLMALVALGTLTHAAFDLALHALRVKPRVGGGRRADRTT